MRNRLFQALAVSLISVALLAGCGTSESDQAKAALKASFLKAVNDGTVPVSFDPSSAKCVADRMVDGIGVDRLKKYKLVKPNADLSNLNMSVADATTLSTSLIDCAPNNGVLTYFRSKLDEGLGAKGTPAVRQCANQVITRAVAVKLLVSIYVGGGSGAIQNFQTSVGPALRRCLS